MASIRDVALKAGVTGLIIEGDLRVEMFEL